MAATTSQQLTSSRDDRKATSTRDGDAGIGRAGIDGAARRRHSRSGVGWRTVAWCVAADRGGSGALAGKGHDRLPRLARGGVREVRGLRAGRHDQARAGWGPDPRLIRRGRGRARPTAAPAARPHGGRVVISFATASLFDSGCGGPIPADFAHALPRASVPTAAFLRGGSRVDLRGRRPFTAHGLTGIATSTVTATLYRARRPIGDPAPVGRVRRLSERLTLTSVSGSERTTLGYHGHGTCDRIRWVPRPVRATGRTP